ncbi:mitochondrial proton/calcium exchanger protein [Neocloeon triangulifer]|uniref:mitochondrial proton/calcium exchanger protein n=1 Tax=Neocloeon triangulifer TaxID=2078957 RepID=UPI00286F7B79|nr:mitochondrial proton/calcium exchanger protein [Neocloeon triangulifer]
MIMALVTQKSLISKSTVVIQRQMALRRWRSTLYNSQWTVHSQTSSLLQDEARCSCNRAFSPSFIGVPLYTEGLLFRRSIHTSSILWEKEPLKPSSKVEASVQTLKESLNEEKKPAASQSLSPAVPKKSVWQKVKDELIHYYHGFRLLFIDINVSRKLVMRILNGKSLTRREHRQLVRTVSDLFRLLPFSVFIIVPFMELLLPLAIKLFPGMLPSTFQSATDKEDKMKQSLKVKLEMAKFLQQTLDNMSLKAKGHHSDAAKEFVLFSNKVRNSGETASVQEILRFSKLFEDEITLDSLSRAQLSALCRVLEINPLGTNNFLRFQLRMKLRSLAADDKVIMKEGVETLTVPELQQACRARGMRAYGMPETRLRAQLNQWLDLSLNEKVPPSLLLLSRALLLPETISTSEQIKASISVLSESAVTQAKAAIGEREGKVDNKTKIELIKEEERRIQEERQERRQQENEEKLTKADIATPLETVLEVAQFKTTETPVAESAKPKELSSKDFEFLEDALDTLGKGKKKLLVEKEELQDLKEEMQDYKEDVQDLQEVISTADKTKVTVKESKGAQALYKRVNKMINKVDGLLSELEKTKKKDIQETLSDTTEQKEEMVSISELMSAIHQIQHVPDAQKMDSIAQVLSKIDDDRDGTVRVDDVLKVIELIGKENVKLSAKQVDEIIELLDKEEEIEIEHQIDMKLEHKFEADNDAPVESIPKKGQQVPIIPKPAQESRPKV